MPALRAVSARPLSTCHLRNDWRGGLGNDCVAKLYHSIGSRTKPTRTFFGRVPFRYSTARLLRNTRSARSARILHEAFLRWALLVASCGGRASRLPVARIFKPCVRTMRILKHARIENPCYDRPHQHSRRSPSCGRIPIEPFSRRRGLWKLGRRSGRGASEIPRANVALSGLRKAMMPHPAIVPTGRSPWAWTPA
jgi:hypothetical protein